MKKIMTVPNVITFVRLFLVPVFAILFFAFSEMRYLALICFIVACISDIADGYIARKYNMVSEIGQVLDPFADKLMYITVVFCLVYTARINFWLFLIYMTKELVMIIAAAIMFEKDDHTIPAKWYGKLSTVLFFLVIVVAIVCPESWIFWVNIAYCVVLLISIYAFVEYGIEYLKFKKSKKNESGK